MTEIGLSGSRAGGDAQVYVFGPDGGSMSKFALRGDRVTVGRLPESNDVALQPDPEHLVTRSAHCTLERQGRRWFIVDGGSVNGTFLRRGTALRRLATRTLLEDGDVICVLASVTESEERRFFELVFEEPRDSQATRSAPFEEPAISLPTATPGCLSYDGREARLTLVRGAEHHEIPLRAQAHQLVRYMADKNASAGSAAVLCTHEELMHAVWGDEPMHTHEELAKLVWELRRKLAPFQAEHLVENERKLGYRLHSCSARDLEPKDPPSDAWPVRQT